MVFNRILLIYSEKETKKHLDSLFKVRTILGNKIFKDVSIKNFNISDLKDKDLVVTVGGDGTFIRVSHYLENLPILGINSEPERSVGEWLSLTSNQLNLLSNIFSNKFEIEEYCRIRAFINEKEIKELAINEIFVGSKNQYNTSRYVIELDNKKEEHRSSGILIVTKKGSSAWYKSAGGKIFYNDKLKYLVREPMNTKIFDSNLISGTIKDKIKIISTMNHTGVIVFDSNKIYKINYGDNIVIKKSKFGLKVVLI